MHREGRFRGKTQNEQGEDIRETVLREAYKTARTNIIFALGGKEECKKVQGLSLRNVGIKIVDTDKKKIIYLEYF